MTTSYSFKEFAPSQWSTVAIVSCASYDHGAVETAVRRGVDLLGGIDQFIRRGERIVLKPNVLAPVGPHKCVTTHPEVFRAAGLLLTEAGANVNYGDSPGVPLLPTALAMHRAGLEPIAHKYGWTLADFDHGRLVPHPRGVTSKKLLIANGVLEADGVVSLPKFKTHGLVRFTGAIKNQYGCIPGFAKGEYHARFPDPYEFSQLVADVCSFVKPRLYILDGIIAMEGNGPQSGEPFPLGVLIFSADPVALDAVACLLVDMDPAFVPTIAAGEKAGLGTCDMTRIKIVGETIDSCKRANFRMVRRPCPRLPTGVVVRHVRNLTTRRPVINVRKCNRCGVCITACPVEPKAIAWRGRKIRKVPRYAYGRCIRCFCCQESCPSGAITIKRPFLAWLVPVASYIGLLLSRITAWREARGKETDRHQKA